MYSREMPLRRHIYIYILWLVDAALPCQDTEKPAAMAERRQAYKDLWSFFVDRYINMCMYDLDSTIG